MMSFLESTSVRSFISGVLPKSYLAFSSIQSCKLTSFLFQNKYFSCFWRSTIVDKILGELKYFMLFLSIYQKINLLSA